MHIDYEGLGTVIILEGSKYWIVMTRIREQEIICSLDSLGLSWNPYVVNDRDKADGYHFEGIHLQKGDVL